MTPRGRRRSPGCADVEAAKSEEYTDVMQSRMGGGLTYRHEDGMNYAHVLPDLIVGSCPQTAADVDTCACRPLPVQLQRTRLQCGAEKAVVPCNGLL